MDWLGNPDVWMALLTLSVLEIVLGVDNLVFISIAVSKLKPEERPRARKIGIAFACITRILLLLTLVYIAQMQASLFSVFGHDISIRDLVLIGGGLFLLVKGAMEINDAIKGEGDEEDVHAKPATAFASVIAQIAVIDIVFSLDSVITAVGMVDANLKWVMVAAIVIAVIAMLIFANPLGNFIDNHPRVKMLALAFLVLVGVVLVADGFDVHINRNFIYVAMGFSAAVEALNIIAAKKANRLKE